MYHIITNKSISDGRILQGENLLVDGDRIIDRGEDLDAIGAEIIDLRKMIVMPGFIDIHVHGAMGYDVMDGTPEALEAISTYKLQEGCTSFCPTTVTGPKDKTIVAIENIRDAKVSGAKIIGAFLEGPYINPKYKGAHPEKYIRPVDINELMKLIKIGESCVKSVIIAPELPGAAEAISELVKMGVQVRLGHSDADTEEVEIAVKAGANQVVHTYNAMPPLLHRQPGMIGVALTTPDLYCELICDLHHVHSYACKILSLTKGGKYAVLITDCMAAGGLPDGEFKLGELTAQVIDGLPRLEDGTIAGSTANMLGCVMNMHKEVGVPFEVAVQMATAAPARALGIFSETGSLSRGKCADIIALDEEYNLSFLMLSGKVRFNKIY